MKDTRYILWIFVGIAVAFAAYINLFDTTDGTTSTGSGTLTGSPIGGDFTLNTHTGETLDTKSLRGKYQLIYFGYSFCPDVCPVDLLKLGTALKDLEDEGIDTTPIQPLFVSVDPKRDTAEMLADYVPSFHPRLIGLTGETDAIEQAKASYKVYSQIEGDADSQDYLISHSALIYFMDKDGKLIRFFSRRDEFKDIVEYIRPYLVK